MARELLFPMHLDAHVVAPGTTSPVADAGPSSWFAAAAPLPAGVHLHWALPDALGHATTTPDGTHLQFPSVPDRWLVIRIAPWTGAGQRATRAWIVDATRGGAPVPLASWTAPAPALASGQRLTALGALPGGRRAVDTPGDELALGTSYYPRAHDRFGFHDKLDDVPAGPLTYLVVGWYGNEQHEPLWGPSDKVRESWLRTRRVVVEGSATGTPVEAPIGTSSSSRPASARDLGPEVSAAVGRIAGMFERVLGIPAAAVAGGLGITVDRVICHGATVGVPWPRPDTPAPHDAGALLYPSIHAAATGAFADLSGEAWLRDYLALALSRASTTGATSFTGVDGHGHDSSFLAHLGRDADAPRFFRPDAPALLIHGLPRTLRHGEDADLDPARREGEPGQVRVRPASRTVTGLNVIVAVAGGTEAHTVVGSGLAAIMLPPSIPAVAGALVHEVMLRDPANLPAFINSLLARVSGGVSRRAIEEAVLHALGAWHRLAVPAETSAARNAFVGAPPMPFAAKVWEPTVRPLYAELEATFAPDPAGKTVLPPRWKLGAVDLEPSGAAAAATDGPSFRVRRAITPVVARILGSTTRSTDVRELALLACALPEIDARVPAGDTVRAGVLRLDRVRVVDTFGMSHGFELPLPRPAVELPPRLAGWARLQVRLRRAAEPATDADATHSPVCGFVVVDRVDHALELFDAAGVRVGQLRHPTSGGPAIWDVDPQRAAVAPSLPVTDPARVLRTTEPDAVLLAIARGFLAAAVTATDTAVSAVVRALDALQPTVERSGASDEAATLLGRPLAIVRAAATLERVAPAPIDPPDLTGAPRVAEPAGFAVPLAFGAVTRSDDGVFGYFARGDFTRFYPVDPDAISPAIPAGATAATAPPARVDHPFVAGTSAVSLAGGETALFTLLVDPRHHLHARTGVLPAKRVTLPKAFYETAMRGLAPSIRVGPVLLPPARPWLPAPAIPGATWRWMHVRPGQAGAAPVEEVLKPPGAGAGLSEGVPVAQDGWLRLVPDPPKP